LQIDILADNKAEWAYLEPSELCSTLHPSDCYDDSIAIKDLDVATTPYCQKIFLPLSGRFKLATLVKKNKGGGDLAAFIYNKKNGEQIECDLPEPSGTSYIEESCIVDLNVFDDNIQDYYVCIKDNIMDNAYTIKSENSQPVCGYSGMPDLVKNASADFALFVQPAAVMPLNNIIEFNEQEFSKFNAISISDYIQDYINNKYGNDCIQGCMIPIAITSANSITVKDLSLSYCAQGLCTTEQNFFELEKGYATISMNNTQLDLRVANFSVDGYGTQKFQLFVGTEKIGEEEIVVEKVPVIKNLVVINAQAGAETEFFAEAYSLKNNSIVSYEWQFGDGGSETTNVNFVNHTYSNVGKFNVVVKATDSGGLKGSRSFLIMIGSPKEILNKTLEEKKIILELIKGEIGKEGWYKAILEKQLKMKDYEALLDEYENQFRLATADSDYVSLITKVEKVILPKLIYDSEFTNDMPVATDVDVIRPELVESLNGGTYDAALAIETKNAIWSWQYKNLAISANSRVIGMIDENDKRENIATIVTMKLKPLAALKEAYLVVLASYDDAIFAADYGQEKTVDSIGFVLSNLTTEQSISLALPGKIDIANLNLFASPYLAELEISEQVTCNNNGICEKQLGENWRNCREDCKPVGLAVFLVIIALALMFSLYLILQKWYKTKYEKYLFKAGDLHNLILFATNSLRKGEEEKDIKEKLKKAGWSSEQVDYVFKKIKGGGIGMPEIKFKFKLPHTERFNK
jgi:PKD repeat protein